jgi:chromosomal replication initiation ATPase DnaA
MELFKPYPTEKQSQIIMAFLKEHHEYLQIRKIERCIGVYRGYLFELIQNRKKSLSEEVIKKIVPFLGRFGFIMPEQELTMQNIQKAVCQKSKLTFAQLIAITREHTIVEERYIAIYFCKEILKKGPTEIAKAFVNFDHATMLYAYKTIKGRLEHDKKLQIKVAEYMEGLQGFIE